MPPLLELPTEILSGVLVCLAQVDLARVCRVSRHLCSIAERFLYQDVRLSTLHTSVPQIQIFLHTILSRPILAGRVQSLAIQWHNVTTDTTTGSSDRDPINPKEIALLSAAGSPLHLELGFQTQEQYIKLLFHLLPRLEILQLSPPFGLNIFDGHRSEQNHMVLSQLRKIHCHWVFDRHATTHASFAAMLMLPCIETLDLRIVGGFDGQGMDWNGVNCIGKSTVTDLRLSYSNMSIENLAIVLAIPRALTRFSCKNLPLDRHFDGPKLGAVLKRRLGTTLNYLALNWGVDAYLHTGNMLGNWKARFAIGSMREWPVLWGLKCSLTLLLGMGRETAVVKLCDVLPKALREWDIELDEWWTVQDIADEVVGLLEAGEMDMLELITIPSRADKVAGGLRVKCEAHGVQLVVGGARKDRL